jgi:hypothetical protein
VPTAPRRRYRLLAATAIVTALSGITSTLLLTTGADADTGSARHDRPGQARTLHLLERDVEHAELDLGAPGLGLGDQFVDTDVLEAPEGEVVGRSAVVCSVVSVAPTLQCQATLVLPEGDLTLAGVVDGATGRGTTAITGGTGSYRQARGQAVLTTLSPTLIDLQLMIDR